MNKTPQNTLRRLSLVALVLGMSTALWAQSRFFGDIYIDNDSELAIHTTHGFSTGSGTYPGIIGTDRDSIPGYLSFATGSTWRDASATAYVDGYVRTYHTTSFVFPVGHNGAYRPVAISGSASSTAAYYGVDPSTAIVNRLDGVSFSALPTGAIFHTDSTATDVQNVSTTEYWDINGTGSTSISLTWDATSDVTTMTGNDLTKLTIVGWDGSQWVRIASTVDATTLLLDTSEALYTGAASSLTAGSITTDAALVPNTYQVYTLAAEKSEVCLAAKAYLQGALYLSANSIMNDDLRVAGLIPTAEPYAALTGFTHTGNGGGETTTAGVLATTGNDAIVDWVFIELRDKTTNTTIVETRSALIQRDGDIVSAADGTSNVCFENLADPEVYVSVRHRNHLGIMAASTQTLTSVGTALDFSTATLYGANAAGFGLKSTGAANTVTSLWLGDVNSDGNTRYETAGNDAAIILNTILAAPSNTFFGGSQGYSYLNQYDNSDVNMDGTIRYEGSNNDAVLILNAILDYPTNTFFGGSQGFQNMLQQLP